MCFHSVMSSVCDLVVVLSVIWRHQNVTLCLGYSVDKHWMCDALHEAPPQHGHGSQT